MSQVLRLLFLLALVCSGPAILAQDPTPSTSFGGGGRTINGTVILQAQVAANVRITIESANRSFHRTVYADGGGSFAISGVPVGGYWVTVETEGYHTLRERLEVPRGTGVVVVQYMPRPAPVADAASRLSNEPAISVSTLKVPKEARSEFEAGLRDMERKRWGRARERFEKALQKHQAFPQAVLALAWLDLNEQQPERALERLHWAVEVDPAYAGGYLLLSRVLNLLGRHTEALQAAQQGTALRPELWELQYELGVAALSLGQDTLALEASERIEALGGPKVPESRLLRAGVLLKRQRYAEAKAQLLAFLEIAPNHRHAPLAKQTLYEVEKGLLATVLKNEQ